MYQRSADKVLTQKPGLQLIGTEYVTDDHVICPLVPQLIGALGDFAAAADNELVSIEEP
jgi:hypothetical protein